MRRFARHLYTLCSSASLLLFVGTIYLIYRGHFRNSGVFVQAQNSWKLSDRTRMQGLYG